MNYFERSLVPLLVMEFSKQQQPIIAGRGMVGATRSMNNLPFAAL